MSYTRDRLGRLTNVKDAVDQAAGQGFGYNDQLQLETEIMTGLVSKTITRSYWDEGTVLGTPKELQVGTAGNPGADYETGYHYDGYGRLERVTGPGLPGYGAVYEYQPDSDLVKKTSFKSDVTTTRGTITRAFEEHRDVVTDVENVWGTTPTLVSKYHYGDADALEIWRRNLRTPAKDTSTWALTCRSSPTGIMDRPAVSARRREPLTRRGGRSPRPAGNRRTSYSIRGRHNRYGLVTCPRRVAVGSRRFDHEQFSHYRRHAQPDAIILPAALDALEARTISPMLPILLIHSLAAGEVSTSNRCRHEVGSAVPPPSG